MVNIGPAAPVHTPIKPKAKATSATVVVSKKAQKLPVSDRRKKQERRNSRHKTLMEMRSGRERRRRGGQSTSIDVSA